MRRSGTYLIEDPYFSIGGGSGYAVAVVMEEDSFFFGIASEGGAQLFDFLDRGVQAEFVAGLLIEEKKNT